jgi:hypothetical protein
MTENTCPVCGFDGDAEFRPRDSQICSACGVEFGYDDRVLSHDDLRREWIDRDCPFFYPEDRPTDWDPYVQMVEAELIDIHQAISAGNDVHTIDVESPSPVATRVRRSVERPTFTVARYALKVA